MAKFIQNKKNWEMVSKFGKDLKIRVGVVEKQTHSSGLDMAYLQTIHHYGVIEKNEVIEENIPNAPTENKKVKIPPRDVYNAPTENKKAKIMARIQSASKMEKKIKDEKFAEIVGEAVLQEAVLETFRSGEGLPINAPSTIAKKGSASPLVNTGELMKAQNWKVVKK